MTRWRNIPAAALLASACLFGFAANAAADSGNSGPGKGGGAKLDGKLAGRAERGLPGLSRAIVVLNRDCDPSSDYRNANAQRKAHFGIINGDLVELPNVQLRRLAGSSCVRSMHWDRPTSGEMNYAAIVEGARAVQQVYGYDGAGIGVAVIDSGVTGWHDDLTYTGNSPKVKVVNGQRVSKFVDFVNGRLTPYDDNGHGTHVSGIIAGNGFDTQGARAGIAPAANIISLKVLNANAAGSISQVIAAMDWTLANAVAQNIRVVNLSVGASVTESYNTDPLTVAAKRLVDQGIVVVAAAGNLGKNPTTGAPQYGGITSPGNAPWVLTVGAYSHQGTLTRTDDVMAGYSSRGPTAVDFAAKPDLVATGTGIASLSVPGSVLYLANPTYLLSGSLTSSLLSLTKPYLSLTGTSMSSPMVSGAVALMLQANPKLTPNMAKAVLQYTAERYNYDPLTQGAGFLNVKGAVDLARFLYRAKSGDIYPTSATWSKTILWGNHKLTGGVIKPAGSAWAVTTVWGAARDAEGDNIVWGTNCRTAECDNIVWGTAAMDADNIVWGTFDREGDNIVWGTLRDADNIVWGTMRDADNIVWGTTCGGADCTGIIWGLAQMDQDNIVWGTARDWDNIVWGTASVEDALFDDPDVPSVFDGVIFDALFGGTDPAPADATLADPQPAVLTESTLVGGGL